MARSPVAKKRIGPSVRSKGYRYIDKDPEMDMIRKIMDDSGMSIPQMVKAANGKVSNTTLYSWEVGKIKRPQNYTLNVVAKACGWERRWVKIGGKE